MRGGCFFLVLGGAAAALEVSRGVAAESPLTSSLVASNLAQVPAVNPGDHEACFAEKKLRWAVDTTIPLKEIKFEVVAYYFPAWHPTPLMERIFDKGWTGYEVLKNSKPLYSGHLFPMYPLWGYFNETDPGCAEKGIETVAHYGIHVWMIDGYWQSGTMFYHGQPENGFLKARSSSKLKFAVMCANHGWWECFAAPTVSSERRTILLPQLHSEEYMRKMIEYCIENYFHDPNYWPVQGALVFGVWNLILLLRTFSTDQLIWVFDSMCHRFARAGLGDLHIQASATYTHTGHEGEVKP
jgi:hypothetical protein